MQPKKEKLCLQSAHTSDCFSTSWSFCILHFKAPKGHEGDIFSKVSWCCLWWKQTITSDLLEQDYSRGMPLASANRGCSAQFRFALLLLARNVAAWNSWKQHDHIKLPLAFLFDFAKYTGLLEKKKKKATQNQGSEINLPGVTRKPFSHTFKTQTPPYWGFCFPDPQLRWDVQAFEEDFPSGDDTEGGCTRTAKGLLPGSHPAPSTWISICAGHINSACVSPNSLLSPREVKTEPGWGREEGGRHYTNMCIAPATRDACLLSVGDYSYRVGCFSRFYLCSRKLVCEDLSLRVIPSITDLDLWSYLRKVSAT